MDIQLKHKIIQLTHHRDELLAELQNLAENLSEQEIDERIIRVSKINRMLKRLSEHDE